MRAADLPCSGEAPSWAARCGSMQAAALEDDAIAALMTDHGIGALAWFECLDAAGHTPAIVAELRPGRNIAYQRERSWHLWLRLDRAGAVAAGIIAQAQARFGAGSPQCRAVVQAAQAELEHGQFAPTDEAAADESAVAALLSRFLLATAARDAEGEFVASQAMARGLRSARCPAC